MAKDDYNVLVYKILVYAYAVFKRKIIFNEQEFKLAILKGDISEEYLNNVLNLMQEDNLISGLKFITAWGSELLLVGDYSDMRITSNGINYLTDNSKMQQVKDFLIGKSDIFASLICKIFPLI